jgi:ribosomal protein S27E
MNPLLFFTAVGTILGLKRTCPRCKRDQIVPASKKRKRVRCKFCGSEIPPRT